MRCSAGQALANLKVIRARESRFSVHHRILPMPIPTRNIPLAQVFPGVPLI